MSGIRINRLVSSFFKHLTGEFRKHFFNGTKFNPLRIYSASAKFPTLDLTSEELVLAYSKSSSVEEIDMLLTNRALHLPNSKLTLENNMYSKKELNSFPNAHVKLIDTIVKELLLVDLERRKDIGDFTNKFKNFVDKRDSAGADFAINHDFLTILGKEGDRLAELVEDLNGNKAFSNAINDLVNKSDEPIQFKAEHIVLQDVIKVFNLIYPLRKKDNQEADLNVKFLLAYLFEKLQGNDMIHSLSLKRINEFVLSDSFDKNIEIIKSASLFDQGEEYRHEFLLPSILKRLENDHFTSSGLALYRIASIIAKADGQVSEAEEEALKQINLRVNSPKTKLEGVIRKDVAEDETLEDVLEELQQLIGLGEVKSAVQELANFLKVQKAREEKGLKAVNNSLHSIFMGPPGTGKTTVARLVSRIYRHLGYLESGHLIETDRTGLVAGYVGQTALKVDELVKSAMHGVLFIDEAYSLASENGKDFGNEAIEVLLKKMEDHRDDFVVIAAGYPDEMKTFVQSNPGLQSRFNRYFTFDHYKPHELLGIFELFCTKNDFKIDDAAKEKLGFIFDKLYETRHSGFGNARIARNLFEKIIEYQANRLVKITPLTEELLSQIIEEDIPPVNKTVEEYLKFEQEEEA